MVGGLKKKPRGGRLLVDPAAAGQDLQGLRLCLTKLSELLCTRDAVYTLAACMDRGRRFTSQFQRMNTMNRKEFYGS